MRALGIQILKFGVYLFVSFLLVAAGAQAQATGETPDHPPVATVYGNTGLWHVYSADTLAAGHPSFNAWYDRFNRDPGYLTIGTWGVSGAVGLTNRLEFGVNFDINTHILDRRADELSFGQQQLGLFGNKTPGSPPLPSELIPGSTVMPQLRFPATPTGVLTGAAGYENNFPFVGSKLESNGVGTVTVGLKLSFFSESKGDPLGLAVHGYATIPTHRSVTFLLSRPVQTGAWQGGFDVILSKNVGTIAQLNWNAGFRGIGSPDDGRPVALSNEVPVGFGIIAPRKTRLQLMSELTADVYVGSHTPDTTFDARDPLDGTIGFRAFLMPSISLSAGYRHNLTQYGGDKNGFVVDLSYSTANKPAPPPPPPPSPPSVTCMADPTEFLAGQLVNLSAMAVSSTPGATLTYQWTATGGTIEGTGPTVRLRTDNLAAGNYTATVRVTDGPGVSADCTTRFTVRPPAPPPAQPPTVSCSADRTTVQVGEIVNITAQARSPQNRPLTYTWTTTGGRVEGTGPTVRFDTTGLQPGTYTVRATVTDDRTLSAECSVQIVVTAPPPPPPPPPPPQVTKLNDCSFRLNSARVDNVCKAKLDDAALRLRNEPDSTLVIEGFAASNERNPAQLANTRAANARTYMVMERQIAQNRIDLRTGPVAPGAEQRRIDIVLVPRGATFTGQNTLPELPGGGSEIAQVEDRIESPIPSAESASASPQQAETGSQGSEETQSRVPASAGISSTREVQNITPRRVIVATTR